MIILLPTLTRGVHNIYTILHNNPIHLCQLTNPAILVTVIPHLANDSENYFWTDPTGIYSDAGINSNSSLAEVITGFSNLSEENQTSVNANGGAYTHRNRRKLRKKRKYRSIFTDGTWGSHAFEPDRIIPIERPYDYSQIESPLHGSRLLFARYGLENGR